MTEMNMTGAVNEVAAIARRIAEEERDGYLGEIAGDLQHASKQLVLEARSLATRMTRLAEDVERGSRSTNSLGEVQGRGLDVDRLCVDRARLLRVVEGYVRVHHREALERALAAERRS